MAITEQTRHHLYLALERQLGAEEAATLMEHLPPVGWADVATKTDLDHLAAATQASIERLAVATDRMSTVLGGRLDAHDRRFDEIDRKFDAVDRRFDGIDGRLDRLEGEMTALRLSVDGLHAAQATFLRQLSLALFVALVSILVAAVGLR